MSRLEPTSLQVCMICLDTERKLFSMTKYNLFKPYKNLIGHLFSDAENLSYTLCAECSQRLKNFSKFRDKSLRAWSVMMDLVNKHEPITMQQVKLIDREHNQLKFTMTKRIQEPDYCDLYIQEYPKEELKEIIQLHTTVRKESCGPIDENNKNLKMKMVNQDNVDDFDSNKDAILDKHRNVRRDLRNDNLDIPMSNNDMCSESEFLVLHQGIKLEKVIDNISPSVSNRDSAHESMLDEQIDIKREMANCNESNNDSLSDKVLKLETELMNDTLSKTLLRETENENKFLDTFESNTNEKESNSLLPERILIESFNLNDDSDNKQFINSEKHTKLGQKNHLVKKQGKKDKKSYSCKLCQYISTGKKALTVHMKTHKKQICCKLCTFNCTLNNDLTTHMKTHADEYLSCQVCKYTCKDKSDLRSHKKTHAKEDRFFCDLCDFKCRINSAFLKHKRSHTGEKPHSCELCDSKFTLRGHLVRHMKIHTGEKPFACDYCDYKFSQRSSLQKHVRTHTGDRPYSCKSCNYKSITNNDLMKHMRTHTGEKPFACTFCDYRSATSYSLITHKRKHTGEKPFWCNLCHYKFARSSQLIRHMRTHTGVKRFTCDTCGFKCTRHTNMVKHMGKHTGRQYTCDYCQYKTVYKSALISHIKRHMNRQ